VELVLVLQPELISVTDELDARTVARLTKSDMFDFFAHFISPSSSQRAKLSVYLVAGVQRSNTGAAFYHPNQATGSPPATRLGNDVEAGEISSSGHVIYQGRLYSRTSSGSPHVMDRIEWKSTLDRIRITPVQDISSFQSDKSAA
jgi:hypothetical protein